MTASFAASITKMVSRSKPAKASHFSTLNGIQTMSARVYNLLGEFEEMRAAGVDVVRISPQAYHTEKILHLFRETLEQRIPPSLALTQMEKLMPELPCNGYWHGKPGLDFIPQPALAASA